MVERLGELLAVAPGPLVSVQDLGRPGLQRYGVAEGGVMDRQAHREGAALLGQSPALAALEMAVVGGRYRVGSSPVQLVLTGASMELELAGRRHPANTVLSVPPRTEVEVGAARSGVYGYLSVGGGFDAPEVLGSRSTHLRGEFGGHEGRLLRNGDMLTIGAGVSVSPGRRLAETDDEVGPIRVLWGLHASEFTEAARRSLLADEFVVTSHRDRQGVRLDTAQPLDAERALALPSAPVVAGDIQVGGDGVATVLLADRQPTGGYPRIATVIEADLGRLAQVESGGVVRFADLSLDEALRARADFHVAIDDLVVETGDELLSHDLISGYTVATSDEFD